MNVIVTMLSDGGINYTRCLLFTYDPKMAKEQKDVDRSTPSKIKVSQPFFASYVLN